MTAAVYGTQFLLYSPAMQLLKPDQIELNGNRLVSREVVLLQFVHDRNRSVLRVPLDARRSQLEQIPWVESASVQRILPNRLRIELTERTPVAFARNGNELALIDAHGVILDRPRGEDLRFPIVAGVSEELPRDQREKRMQTYEEFMKDVDLVRGGSSDRVSEIDLSNPKDLRVVMTGLASANDAQAVTIHFGAIAASGRESGHECGDDHRENKIDPSLERRLGEKRQIPGRTGHRQHENMRADRGSRRRTCEVLGAWRG